MVNVICIKWGTLYSDDYVNKLYGMVARNLKRPFRFACFTDDGRAGLRREAKILPILPIKLPASARIIAFPGEPKMPDAAQGRWPGGWHKFLCETLWIDEYWRE